MRLGATRRHRLIGRAGLLPAIAAAVSLLAASGGIAHGTDARPGSPDVVQLATIPAVQTGGLLTELVTLFEEETGYEVEVFVGNGDALLDRARAGDADLVVIHTGHEEPFVTEGLAQWPKAVLANSLGFIVPATDPANVRGASDPVDAFQRIAATRSPFVANRLETPLFVTDTLWHAAGRPDRTGWYVDEGLAGQRAVQRAAELGGYTIWGLHPFLTRPQPPGMTAQAFDDSLMQRVIASMVVDPERFPYANVDGGLALQEYLREPATQAAVRAFRHPAVDQPIFWPAGHQSLADS